MRRAIVVLVLALVVGGIVASLMMRDPGYVMLVYDRWSLETSLWFALAALFVAYAVARVLFSLLRKLVRSPAGLRDWNDSRRARKAHEQTQRGVLLLAEGEAGAAREALIGAAEHAELPLVNYLAAARAAADAGDWAACDSLIDRAAGAAPGAALGARLEGVAIREQRGLIGECRATLEALRTDAPRHARVLQALAECYRSLGDWSALAGLVPELERHKAIGEDRARPFARAAALGRMGELGADALLAHWAGVPRRVQTDGEVVRAFANAARRAGVPDAAEEALRRAIEQRWDSELVELYGRLASAAPAPRRKHVDTWLAGHADDAALWLASGRIALSEHDWTKAREHFETSLKRAAGAPVYGELGRLCHALGERDRGAEYLLRCVELGGADLPALPMPQRGA